MHRIKSGRKRVRYHSTTFSAQSESANLNGLGGVTHMAGRPPWYDISGNLKEAFVIGLSGSSGSGKTTVAHEIIKALKVPWVNVLSMDSFYKQPGIEERKLIERGQYDFDHPDAVDFDLCVEALTRLKKGRQMDVPVYNFVTHSREQQTLIDLRVFVDTDADICLARRLRRDTTQRGRTIESTIEQYIKFVKPAADQYVQPTMRNADVILPRGVSNFAAMGILLSKVKFELTKRGFRVRNQLMARTDFVDPHLIRKDASLKVLQESGFVRHAIKVIRNRVIRSAIEIDRFQRKLLHTLFKEALSTNRSVLGGGVGSPKKEPEIVGGGEEDAELVCAITILRETAASTASSSIDFDDEEEVVLGLITIRTNILTNEAELHYVRLPEDVEKMKVMIADTSISTGAAAMMAIRTILDHGVDQAKITLLSCSITARGLFSYIIIMDACTQPRLGYHLIRKIYPQLCIITASLEECYDNNNAPAPATISDETTTTTTITPSSSSSDDDDNQPSDEDDVSPLPTAMKKQQKQEVLSIDMNAGTSSIL